MGRIVSNRILGDGTTYENVQAAITANGLDWTVTKHPLFARIPTGYDASGKQTGVFRKASNAFGVVRDDSRATLGIVRSAFVPIQNATAFAPLDTLAQEGGLHIMGAGELGGGAQVYMQAATPSPLVIAGDKIATSLIVFMGHDGTSSLRYLPSFVRFACTNQMRSLIALARRARNAGAEWAIPIRHSANSAQRIEAAHAALAHFVAAQTAFKDAAETLLARSFSAVEMRRLADELLPRPEAGSSDRAVQSWGRRMDALMRDAYLAPDLDNVRGTAWGALNAVADFEQHMVRATGDEAKREATLFVRSFEEGAFMRQAVAVLAR